MQQIMNMEMKLKQNPNWANTDQEKKPHNIIQYKAETWKYLHRYWAGEQN